jgi:aspartate racemase
MVVHHFLEDQAKQSPTAVALRVNGTAMSYQELDDRTNQLAHYLQQQGIGTRVGIYCDRSFDLVVGIIAALKAGITYIPLDPAYPAARINYILEQTKPQAILSQSHLQPIAPDPIYLDGAFTGCRPNPATPAEFAYILYTSGSTGQPKGVPVTYASVSQYISALAPILGITAQDVYLHTASFSFSSAVRQLLIPLSRGATCVIASREQTQNPFSLLDLITSNGVTVMDTVASVWRYLLMSTGDRHLELPLQKVIFSGELTPSSLLVELRDRLSPQTQFFNIYGQTETIGTSCYPVPSDWQPQSVNVPVGKVYPHWRAYVLDEYNQIQEPGRVGELCIAGRNLLKNYLGKDSCLQPNPWADSPEFAYLFRTGDQVRCLADGNLEVVGRTDFQVKIRGMRVEIGEVEAVLEQHPHVKQAVVVAKAGQLWAYHIGDRPPEQLRAFLQKYLPDYAIPQFFVAMKSFPTTVTGKLDRLALINRVEPETINQATSTDPIEKALIEIWQIALGHKNFQTTDKFFEVGGHSLLASVVFAQISKRLGKNLPIDVLFQHQTIQELSRIVKSADWDQPWSMLVRVKPHGSKPPLFCVHGIGGGALYYSVWAKYLPEDLPLYGLQAAGLDGKTPPHDTIAAAATASIQEIRTVQPRGPYYLGGHSFGGLVAYEMAYQLEQAGETVNFLGLFDTYSPSLLRQRPPRLMAKMNVHLFNLARLTPEERIDYFLDRIKWRLARGLAKITGDKARATQEILANQMAVTVANDRAAKSYEPGLFQGKVTLFRAQVRPARFPDRNYLGWDTLALNLEVHEVPGNHASILSNPAHVQALMAKLDQCLAWEPVPENVTELI